MHPIRGDELRALRRLQREQEPKSNFVFTTERGGSMAPDSLGKLVKRLGKGSELRLQRPSAHVAARLRLRLANAGHDTRLIAVTAG